MLSKNSFSIVNDTLVRQSGIHPGSLWYYNFSASFTWWWWSFLRHHCKVWSPELPSGKKTSKQQQQQETNKQANKQTKKKKKQNTPALSTVVHLVWTNKIEPISKLYSIIWEIKKSDTSQCNRIFTLTVLLIKIKLECLLKTLFLLEARLVLLDGNSVFLGIMDLLI